MRATSGWEFVAVAFGIASVAFSRKQHILVYPTGLVNTVLYTWFCLSWWGLYAEASLNVYYTAMSIYGWWLWSRKNTDDGQRLRITKSTRKEWLQAGLFFGVCYGVLWLVLARFTNSTVPMADAFASAAAYTGMWLMAKKKLEHWLWWMLTNVASVPLYFAKGAVFTSFQYLIFLVLAVAGYAEWKKTLKHADA
ncbi:MAG: nicotinamide riboside transporter PnuC [Bacteroidetes bacterium]|nr:MAG: nicotinamide riboside transporter PnuC [Bacteroidota bacterium]